MKRRHSLIIGGSSGIGRAQVKTLAEENRVVSVIGRRAAAADAFQNMPDVHYWSVDLLKEEQLSTTLIEILERNGKLNDLIFFQRYRGKDDDWQGEIEAKLTATRNIIERLAGEFESAADNSIIVVSSLASDFVAREQPLSYHVAKAGLNQMVRYYAVMLGAQNIRVNSVSPGAVLKEEAKEFYLNNEALCELYERITPLGRMGTAEEVSQVIAFLCSPKASFITGQNIIVDGGLSLELQESLARRLLT